MARTHRTRLDVRPFFGVLTGDGAEFGAAMDDAMSV